MKTRFAHFFLALFFVSALGFACLRYVLPFDLPTEPYSVRLLDRSGAEIGEILSEKGFRHQPLPADSVPEFTKKALVNLEDRRFYSHFGIDPAGIARAIYRNLRFDGVREGASTLDSWLVRNALWIDEKRTWWKKIVETAYAVRLDGRYSKDEILSRYLNRISFGRLSKGYAAAARSYFGKQVRNLTEAEQLALLVMAKNPSKYDPVKNPAAFRERFASVAGTLAANGVIPQESVATIVAEKLSFPSPKNALPYVSDAFKSKKFAIEPNETGTDVSEYRTSFDLALTNRVRQIGDGTLDEISWRSVSDYSVLIVDRKTKEVLVMVGWADYDSSAGGQVNAVFAPRQVGSTIKPFTYLLAVQNEGVSITDTLLDLPVAFETAEWTPYEPKNYSLSYRWPVTVAEALAGSLNVPAVKMGEKVGVSELLRFLRSLGITTLTEDADHYGLALTLGVGEIPLYELLRAYGIFANGGKLCDFVTSPGAVAKCSKAANAGAVKKIEDVLTNRAYKLREFSALTALDFPDHFVFVKTGTSRNFRDNYAVGYTNRYLVATWSGNKDGSNMKGVSWATGAGEIFSRIVHALEEPGGAPKEAVSSANRNDYLEIVSPLPGSRYRKDETIPVATQIVSPKFATGIPFDRAEWKIDGGEIEKNGIPLLDLEKGEHELVLTLLRDGAEVGKRTVRFVVEEESSSGR